MKLPLQLVLCVLIVGLAAGQCYGQVKRLSDFRNTDFLPTLEHTFKKDRNAIYAASFLYSIDEIKTKLDCPVKADNALSDLALVLASASHRNTLRDGEFTADVKIGNGTISARASFQKSLPFQDTLFAGHGLQFGGRNVASFEWLGEPEGVVQILYFKDDSNFTLKLLPRDAEHEIILSMTDITPSSLLDLVTLVNKNIEVGQAEKERRDLKWKYSMTPYDIVMIPELALNIEAHYPSLEGSAISCNKNRYHITSATQQTAFYLNERGAEVKSEGVSEVIFAEPVEEEGVTPKRMIFSKPFFVMLRRADADYPYFCMWVVDTEHMISWK